MLKLIIEDDEGRKTVVPFARDEISIGRQDGNTVRLTERNVSRQHARLRREAGGVVVQDLGSSYGTRLNGQRLKGEAPLREGDLLQIGDYDLALQGRSAAFPEEPLEPTAPTGQALLQHVLDPTPPPAGEVLEPSEVPTGPDLRPELPLSMRSTPGTSEDAVPTRQDLPAVRRFAGEDEATPVPPPAEVPGEDLSLAPEEAPRLLVLNTELAGREYACIRTQLKLGRTADNDIPIDHPSLSRSHARLVRVEGVWTLIDQASVNGVRLHGAKVDRAGLTHGDEFELGHVRLRFLGGTKPRTGVQRTVGRLAMVALALVLLAVIGSAALLAFEPELAKRFLPPAILDRLALAPAAPAAQETPPGNGTPTVPETAAPALLDPPKEMVPPGLQGAVLQRYTAAVEAANARDFQRTVELLEGFADAERPGEATALLLRARSEAKVRHQLSAAQVLLDSGRAAEAAATLEGADATRAYARELAIMKGRVAAAREAEDERALAQATEGRKVLEEQLAELYIGGRDALKAGRIKRAETLFQQCVALDPRAAACHLGLGGTYARTRGKTQLGAEHYKTFLELAPDDPAAAGVKKLLADYQRAMATQGE